MKTQQISQYSNPASNYLNSNKMRGISKRHRTHFTNIQVEKLEEIFTANQNPYRDLIIHLSSSLNLTHKNILIWFKNRRAKEKRQNKMTRSDEEGTQEVEEKNATDDKSTVSKEALDSFIPEPPTIDPSEKSPSQLYEPPMISSFKETFYHRDQFPQSDALPMSEQYNSHLCYNSQQYLYPPSYNPHYRSPYIDYGYPPDSGRTDYSYHDAPIYPSPYYHPAPYSFHLRPDINRNLDPKEDASYTDSIDSSSNPIKSVTNPSESGKNEAVPHPSLDSIRNDTTYGDNELRDSSITVSQLVDSTETATPRVDLSVNSQISLSHYKFNYL